MAVLSAGWTAPARSTIAYDEIEDITRAERLESRQLGPIAGEPLDHLQVGIGGRASITDGDRVVPRATGRHASLRRHGKDPRQFGSVYLVAGIVAPSRRQASGLWW